MSTTAERPSQEKSGVSDNDWKYVERYDTHVRWRENPDTAFGIDLEMQGIGGGWFSISAAHLWFLIGRASVKAECVPAEEARRIVAPYRSEFPNVLWAALETDIELALAHLAPTDAEDDDG